MVNDLNIGALWGYVKGRSMPECGTSFNVSMA